MFVVVLLWSPTTVEYGLFWYDEGCPLEELLLIFITNYQMAPSKRGAGGGSATHKEPT